MENEINQGVSVDELNAEWSKLVSAISSRYIVENLALKKEVEALQELKKTNVDLKAQLHQAQVNLLAAQGKAIIDDR
jgi:predicted GNAT superfamily acetyltransferase